MLPEAGLVEMMALLPPTLLLDMMGVWASITGLCGFIANAAAICLFCKSRKVNIYWVWCSANIYMLPIPAQNPLQLDADEPVPHRAAHCQFRKLHPCLQLLQQALDTVQRGMSGKCFWNDLFG